MYSKTVFLFLLRIWGKIVLVSKIKDCNYQAQGTSAVSFEGRLLQNMQSAVCMELITGSMECCWVAEMFQQDAQVLQVFQ